MKSAGKILVVDDEPSSISLIVRLLKPSYRLAVAKNGEEALRLAASPEDPPDLILLDLIMPEMDGYEACRRLKAMPETRDIPVIFLTIKDDIEAETRGLELGAVDYIAKPVSPPILLARVGTHLTLNLIQRDLDALVLERTAELAVEQEELRETAKDLRRALSEVEAATRVKNAFLSVMSHEMRTPVHAILGMNQLLERAVTDPQGQEYLTLQRKAIRGLTTVIDDVLMLSDLESRGMRQDPTSFELGKMLESLQEVLGAEAAEKGLVFDIQRPVDIALQRWGDVRRLRQVLLMLLGNAIKFTPQGRVALTVEELSPGQLRFHVTDTGVGIPEEWHARIFEPFTQVDSSISRRYNGSGLGLSLAKRLADTLGGQIQVQSKVGSGSTFIFSAPFPTPGSVEVSP